MEQFSRVEDVAKKSFDFIVVGGGVAGSVMASRLSENPETSVLLLEAGKGRLSDYYIDKPIGALWLNEQLGNVDYEWLFKTSPQKTLNERVINIPNGKGMGGSSNTNMQMWLRPGRDEINAWERLGNPGWGYNNILPCIKKAENFHPPSADAIKNEALEPEQPWYGKNGPIHISYCEFSTGLDQYYRKTAENRGIPFRTDSALGEYTGYWSNPLCIDPVTITRSTAFKGYILPNLGRENLFVVPEAHAAKVLTKKSDDGVTAEGVEFVVGGETFVAYAAKEVLLCAGAINTPKLLELSGIGRPEILKPLNIPVLLNLPGVGENLADHYLSFNLSFELSPDFKGSTLDIFLEKPEELQKCLKLYGEGKHSLLSYAQHEVAYVSLQSISSNAEKIIERHEKQFESRIASASSDPERVNWLKAQRDIQLAALRNPKQPQIEYMFCPYLFLSPHAAEPGKKYITIACCMVMPWSRGTTHITSSDPLQPPDIDMNFFDFDIELDILTETFKWARQLKDHEPMKSIIAKEVNPGDGKMVTDEEIREYFRTSIFTFFHVSGTASMLPRDKMGVVDPKLKVYGTTNLRVCDYSISPISPAVHSQCTTYGIAERAAEIIKADM